MLVRNVSVSNGVWVVKKRPVRKVYSLARYDHTGSCFKSNKISVFFFNIYKPKRCCHIVKSPHGINTGYMYKCLSTVPHRHATRSRNHLLITRFTRTKPHSKFIYQDVT